jgi:hypothetical protein
MDQTFLKVAAGVLLVTFLWTAIKVPLWARKEWPRAVREGTQRSLVGACGVILGLCGVMIWLAVEGLLGR